MPDLDMTTAGFKNALQTTQRTPRRMFMPGTLATPRSSLQAGSRPELACHPRQTA